MKTVLWQCLSTCSGVVLTVLLSACAGQPEAGSSAAEAGPSHRIELPGLSEAERASIGEGNKTGDEPMQAGLGRELDDEQARIPLTGMDWQATGDRREARFVVQSVGATGLRLGMRLSDETDCPLTFRFAAPHGSPGEAVPAERLVDSDGLWWSPIVSGDTVVVHLVASRDGDLSGCRLRIPTLSHLY